MDFFGGTGDRPGSPVPMRLLHRVALEGAASDVLKNLWGLKGPN